MEKDSHAFLKEYEKEMKRFVLPLELAAHWKTEQCLKDGENNWTILIKEEESGVLCVLKWAEETAAQMLLQEYEILKELEQNKIAGIPRVYRLMKTENGVYLLREYVSGCSVFEKMEEQGRISEEEIVSIGIALCKLVEQLQKLETPLIHRDIKPENIILTPSGTVALIDFGTVRRYRADDMGHSSDTFVAGSRGTAAPEQYGYYQTDERTDVYAIGQTLLYMVTGCYEMEMLDTAEVSRRLKRIIHKAAAFDPKARYKNAESVEKALLPKKKMWKTSVGIVAAFVVGLLAGMLSCRAVLLEGQETEVQSSAEDLEVVKFQEPLIERAVRAELGLSESDVIEQDMLEKISSIRILGTEVLSEDEQFGWIGSQLINWDQEFGSKKGSIVTLSDLSAMPNLTDVEICNQNIRDLTPLKNLPVQKLYLSDNLISDFSVLAEMTALEELCIQGNPADDLDVLENCYRIKSLRISNMVVKDIRFMKKISLYELGMEQLTVKDGDFSPLKEQQGLVSLYISNVGEEEAEVIRELQGLENLNLGRDQKIHDLTLLGGMKNLVFLSMAQNMTSIEGIADFPVLRSLNLYGSKITDISALTEAKGLEEIDLRETMIDDLTPLFEIQSLEKVVCDEKTKARIREINPSPSFELI